MLGATPLFRLVKSSILKIAFLLILLLLFLLTILPTTRVRPDP